MMCIITQSSLFLSRRRSEAEGVWEDIQRSPEAGDVRGRGSALFFFWSASCSQTLDTDPPVYP